MRCQIPRNKIDDQADDLIMGELPDGRLLCREIGTGDIDRVSGFAEADRSRAIELYPAAKREKYLLRENDILFAFAGVPRSLAATGLIVKLDEPAITARTICLIRAFDIDPVWLFYQLRRPLTKNRLSRLARERETAATTINLEDLREARLIEPTPGEIEAANAARARVIEETRKIREARENASRELAKLNSLFALNSRNYMGNSR